MTNWIWDNLGTISLLESMTEEGVTIVDVRDMRDGCKDPYIVADKIRLVSGLLSNGRKVAIRCTAGMNRSNAIALGTMCYMVPHDDKDINNLWNHHLKVLKEKVPRAMILPTLERTVKRALKELL